MDKNTLIKVINRAEHTVGYTIPERGVRRQFGPRQEREIEFGELEDLSFLPGGDIILLNYLVVKDEEAVKKLFGNVEPEYFYTADDVKRILTTGSIDEFLDCLECSVLYLLQLLYFLFYLHQFLMKHHIHKQKYL